MSSQNVFTVGGTVQAGSGRYIHRKVDDELLRYCREGQFAFVLTARQMGKSSIMIRTSERLQEEGVQTVIIDLSQMGVQVTEEAWYFGFIMVISRSLRLRQNVFQWWKANEQLGYTQRMTQFFREIVLEELDGQVVIFVDEIDSTLSLPFTDDFFAAIRYVYNARSNDPAFKRISFVLIGVATPSDLMKDTRRTPFNVGQRVELAYFTAEEARPLACGFDYPDSQARQVVDWVIERTGGHPYLTQRLCQLIFDRELANPKERDIDNIVTEAFSGQKSEHDSNLRFVNDMLTRRSEDPLEVLAMYQRIRKGRRVADDKQSLVLSHLKLAGVVKRKNGHLVLSNAIYKSVFNEAWIKQQWPEHWIKRVPPAVIGLAVASFVAVVLLGLALLQAQQVRSVEQQAALQDSLNQDLSVQIILSDSLRSVTEEANQQLFDQVRISDSLRMSTEGINAQLSNQISVSESLRQQTTEANVQLSSQIQVTDSLNLQLASQVDVSDSLRLITEQQLAETQLARLETITIALASKATRQLRLGNAELGALLARQAYLFSEQGDGEFIDPIYDAMRQSLNALSMEEQVLGGPAVLDDFDADIRAVSYSPDGRWLAVGGSDGMLNLLINVGLAWENYQSMPAHKGAIRTLAFSPDGTVLATGGEGGKVYLWHNLDTDTPERTEFHDFSRLRVWTLALSSDGYLATAGNSSIARVRNIENKADSLAFDAQNGRIRALAFHPKKKALAIADETGLIHVWDTQSSDDSKILRWNAGQGALHSLSFSPSGDFLATGGDSLFTRVWALEESDALPGLIHTLQGHEGPIHAVAYSPDGLMLASGSSDRSVQVWDTRTFDSNPILLQEHSDWIWALDFDPSSRYLASGSADRTVRIWSTQPADFARQICEVLEGRELTEEEWEVHIGEDFTYAQEYQSCGNTAGVNRP